MFILASHQVIAVCQAPNGCAPGVAGLARPHLAYHDYSTSSRVLYLDVGEGVGYVYLLLWQTLVELVGGLFV